MKKHAAVQLRLYLLLFLLHPLVGYSQAGSLDLSFDGDGIVATSFGTVETYGRAMALQNDGKIVVAGSTGDFLATDFIITRYNSNGSLDQTFDVDGKVITGIGTLDDQANAIAIQSDGKIVVVGNTYDGAYDHFGIVRYNTNGSLDNTFNMNGKVITQIGPYTCRANAVAIQNDGKILVAGWNTTGSNEEFAVVRYNPNGSLDNTFDTDGIVTTSIPGSSIALANAISIQSDGKIVVSGYSMPSGTKSNFTTVRYHINGSLDNTFDLDGIVTTEIGTSIDEAFSSVIQPDGKIVVSGISLSGANGVFAMVRYKTDGSLDTSFDIDGKVTTSIGSNSDESYTMALQSDGKILLAGNSTPDFALVRYLTNGSLDTSFSSDGKVTTNIQALSYDYIYGMGIQNDGKIVVAGYSNADTLYYISLARYQNNIATGMAENLNPLTQLKISPNPFSTVTTFTSNSYLHNATLTLYNIQGESVMEINSLEGYVFHLQRNDLIAGLYFAQLKENNRILLTQKMVVKD